MLRGVAPTAARGMRTLRRGLNNQADRIRSWSTQLRDKAHAYLNEKMYDSSNPALNASRAGGQVATTALTAAIPIGNTTLGSRAAQGVVRAVSPLSWRMGNRLVSTAGGAAAQLLSKIPGVGSAVNAAAPRIGAAYKATEPIRNIGATSAGVVWPYADKAVGFTQEKLDDSDAMRSWKRWSRTYPQYFSTALNPATTLNSLWRVYGDMDKPLEDTGGYVASNHWNTEYNPSSIVDTLAADAEKKLVPYTDQVIDYANKHPNMPPGQLLQKIKDSAPSTWYTRILSISPSAKTLSQQFNSVAPYTDIDNPEDQLGGAAKGALQVIYDSDRAARSVGGDTGARLRTILRDYYNKEYPTGVIIN